MAVLSGSATWRCLSCSTRPASGWVSWSGSTSTTSTAGQPTVVRVFGRAAGVDGALRPPCRGCARPRWLTAGRPRLRVEGSRPGALLPGGPGLMDRNPAGRPHAGPPADRRGARRSRPGPARPAPHRSHPPPRGEAGPAVGPGAARALLARDHGALHPMSRPTGSGAGRPAGPPSRRGSPPAPPGQVVDRRTPPGVRREALFIPGRPPGTPRARRLAQRGRRRTGPAPTRSRGSRRSSASDPAPVQAGTGEAVGAPSHLKTADRVARGPDASPDVREAETGS